MGKTAEAQQQKDAARKQYERAMTVDANLKEASVAINRLKNE